MTQPIIKSIETNAKDIETNNITIDQIKDDISDIRLGVAIKDEYSSIKYTGYTDWRLRLEIYSNIDAYNSNVLKEDLLFNNNNTLEVVDYIHLLSSSNEILVSSNIEIRNYYDLQPDSLIKRTYQSDTYQNYIVNKSDDRLLMRFTLNMLLKESISKIDFISSSSNLPPYSYFINYEHKGTYIDPNPTNPDYTNCHKGWNTIDWFFIYDKINYNDTRITLGFNPLINANIKSKTELITGFLAYNPTSTLKNTEAINYTISTINDQDNEFIIKQEVTPIEEYNLTKTFTFNFSNINDDNYSNILTFNTDLNFSLGSLKFNSITLHNNNTNLLNVNKLNFSFNNSNINTVHDQIIKHNDYYTFNTNQFTSNLDINGNSEFTSNQLKNFNKPFNINFNSIPTPTLNYNIRLEFYLEIRSTNNNTNLLFTTKEQDDYKYLTNNKIIFSQDGSIGIGTDDSQNYSLYVNNINSTKKGIYCADDITILSDARFKTNIKTIENPIEKLMALRGVSYNRIDRDINENRFGFIAQEVQKVLPEACDEDKGIKTTDIVALLVEAVKELAKNVK
jgi:hypothetical protein